MLAALAGCGGASATLPSSAAAGPSRFDSTHHGIARPAYSVLYRFAGGSGDGAYPYAGLVNVNGTLYGTAYEGGAKNDGAVFSITASGTESMLHSFGSSRDGSYPYASLLDVKGVLYSTTYEGGTKRDGTVFSITPSGKESVLHSFGGSGDGVYPYAGLVDVNGTLYGTTYGGGANSEGTVFSIAPSGKESVLYSFKGGSADGAQPWAALVQVKGKLYGTTAAGGANGDGTVFSITLSGTERVLHSFEGGSADGAEPYAGLVDVKTKLYGTTYDGGANNDGTVFSITPSGKEKMLHSFAGGSGDGRYPYAGLINVKNVLYGTTFYGGSACGGGSGCGTVFSITPSGTETVLYSFAGSTGNGEFPYASVIDVKGNLYGTTPNGGNGFGTVFQLSP